MNDEGFIERKVKEIIAHQLFVKEERLTLTASLVDDLGADSFDTVELMMVFQDQFKNELRGGIPQSDADKLQTVGQVIDFIRARRDDPGSARVQDSGELTDDSRLCAADTIR